METYTLPHYHSDDAEVENILDEVQDVSHFASIANVFKQLGDPTRVRIYWMLCHCEECVGNIAAAMDMTSPAVSHHLRLLCEAGLTEKRRDGKEVYYRACDTDECRLLHEMIEDVMEIRCPK